MILQPFKPEVEAFVQQELESGRYTNLNDLLEQAIALLLHKRSHHENWIETMRETVDGAIAELDRGEGLDGEQVIAELYDRLYQKAETIDFQMIPKGDRMVLLTDHFRSNVKTSFTQSIKIVSPAENV